MPRYIDPDTGKVVNYDPPAPELRALPLGTLFKVPAERTLKLRLREGCGLAQAVESAKAHLAGGVSNHTRVEFKYEDYYIVVAKLKEEEER